jgi:hypothetical protein
VAPTGAIMDAGAVLRVDGGAPPRSVVPPRVQVLAGAGGAGWRDRLSGGLPSGDDTSVGWAPIAPSGEVTMRADAASALRAVVLSRDDEGENFDAAPGWREHDVPAATHGSVARGGFSAGLETMPGGGGEAVAPGLPSMGAGGAGGGGEIVLGNIHLDGHPVGVWMGTRLARDAARPGAGTTGFDPRQAAAWTPSGAL